MKRLSLYRRSAVPKGLIEILTSVKRLYIHFKSLVNDFVYSFGRVALLFLVEV